ncbi:protein MKS1-like [Alnus glutinosa]|uniref:protein MKS1-like n=1 Tax=Alnus glutinosa TaxID=3517 RepID=UPI002D7715F3|nr:protein MKS1-like [Alnus glutinosa]
MDSFGDKNHNMVSSQTRKQMQGPRPAPLTVSRSSTKIIKKKQPVPAPGQSRSPVIIYLKSPTVIHVRPEEFRDTVQRLTGLNQAPSTVPDSAHHSYSSPSYCGMVADANMGCMGISSSFWNNVDLCMLSGVMSLRRAFDDIV